MKDDHVQAVKAAADTVSAVFTIGALLDLLPAIAAGLSIIWYTLRIWEHVAYKIKLWRERNKGGEN
jgi:hypothetical protein